MKRIIHPLTTLFFGLWLGYMCCYYLSAQPARVRTLEAITMAVEANATASRAIETMETLQGEAN